MIIITIMIFIVIIFFITEELLKKTTKTNNKNVSYLNQNSKTKYLLKIKTAKKGEYK